MIIATTMIMMMAMDPIVMSRKTMFKISGSNVGVVGVLPVPVVVVSVVVVSVVVVVFVSVVVVVVGGVVVVEET